MEKKLELSRKLARCIGDLDLELISTRDHSMERFLRSCLYSSILPVASTGRILQVMLEMECGCLYIMGSIPGIQYAMFRLDEERILTIGPCLEAEFSESRIRAELHSFRLSAVGTERVMDYCRAQPVLSAEKLHRLGMLVGSLVLELPEPIPHRRVHYRWDLNAPALMQEPEEFHIHRIEQRYESGLALTEAVKQGNLSLAYSFAQGFYLDRSYVNRSGNPLRNAQNICLTLNVQLRCAMEECGVHPYRLDAVSDGIGQSIEKLDTPEAAGQLCVQIVRAYCELAMEKRYPELNRLARQAVVYIKGHLGDNLTVKDTAQALRVNANYLSGVFRRELGMTFIDFLNRQRAEQAAALLRRTNIQIQHIAADVGYNNTSYFTRRFAAVYGCTPKEYRANGVL